MQIIYNGVEITDSISIGGVMCTDNEGGTADSVVLGLTDTEALLPRWEPRQGDKLRVRQGQYDSGEMHIDHIVLKRDMCTLRAASLPPDVRVPTWQSWEEIRFMRLIAEIAQRYGLTPELYDMPDVLYQRLTQNGEQDIEFLSRLCMLEGCALKIMDTRLIIYDQLTRESTEPVRVIDMAGSVGYCYTDYATERLHSVSVISGGNKGTAIDPSGLVCRGGNKVVRDISAHSPGEAARYARGILREQNKRACILDIMMEFDGLYAAGEVVQVIGNPMLKGKWFVREVRHDLVRQQSRLQLRRCLNW